MIYIELGSHDSSASRISDGAGTRAALRPCCGLLQSHTIDAFRGNQADGREPGCSAGGTMSAVPAAHPLRLLTADMQNRRIIDMHFHVPCWSRCRAKTRKLSLPSDGTRRTDFPARTPDTFANTLAEMSIEMPETSRTRRRESDHFSRIMMGYSQSAL